MSYLTSYQIEAIKGEVNLNDVQKYLLDAGWSFSRGYDENGEFVTYISAVHSKFYAYNVIKEVSLFFHDVVFRVHGEGDNPDDNWTIYYYNGMFQNANRKVIIIEDEFDYDNLVSLD